MSCTCRVAILSWVKITTIFFSEYCRLVLPSTVLPEPYTSQHKLVNISGTSLHFWLQRSRIHHRCLRPTGWCISSKWVLAGTIIPVQGTLMALRSGWNHWKSDLEITVTTLRFELFCSHLKAICISLHPAVSQIRVKGWLASLGHYICLIKMSI